MRTRQKAGTENKKTCFALALFLAFAVPFHLHAHPGRVDSQGGHIDRRTGTYHYHSQAAPTPAKSAPSGASSKNRATKTPGEPRVGKWGIEKSRGKVRAVLRNNRGLLTLSSSGTGFRVIIGLVSGFVRPKNPRPVVVTYRTATTEKTEKWNVLSGHLSLPEKNAEDFQRALRGQKSVTLVIQDENEPDQIISFDLLEIDKVLDLLEENHKAEKDK